MVATSIFTRSTRLLYSSNSDLVDFLAVLERTKSTIWAPPTVIPPAPATIPPNDEMIKVTLREKCIWSFSGPHFPAFGLNTERYGVSLCIQSKCGKVRTRKTPNTNTFHAVLNQDEIIVIKANNPSGTLKH